MSWVWRIFRQLRQWEFADVWKHSGLQIIWGSSFSDWAWTKQQFSGDFLKLAWWLLGLQCLLYYYSHQTHPDWVLLLSEGGMFFLVVSERVFDPKVLWLHFNYVFLRLVSHLFTTWTRGGSAVCLARCDSYSYFCYFSSKKTQFYSKKDFF